jgi:hypothetical protein
MRVRTLAVSATAVAVMGLAGHSLTPAAEDATRANGDEERVSRVVDQLGKAGRDSDGAQVCERLFDAGLRKSVETAAGRPCAEEVRANIGSPKTSFRIRSLRVTKNAATVVVVDQAQRKSSLFLQHQPDGWRISGVGA